MPLRKALLLGFAGLILNGIFYGSGRAGQPIQTAGDFLHFYVGARLAGSADEYRNARVAKLQKQIIGDDRPRLMPSRLPFYYSLLSPLGRLPFSSAFYLWIAAMATAAILAAMVLARVQGPAAIAATLGSAPLLVGILKAQDVALVYLILAAGLWLRRSGRPIAAGLVLSLTAIKFNLFLLAPIPFLLKREFRLLGGAAIGLAALGAGCFAAAGSHWPSDYVRLILDPVISPGPMVMPNLHGALSQFTKSAVVESLLTTLVVALVIIASRKSPFPAALASGLIGSMLVSRHAYTADCVVLIPAFLAMLQTRRSPALEIALISMTPFPYLMADKLGYGFILAGLLAAALIVLAAHTEEKPPPASLRE